MEDVEAKEKEPTVGESAKEGDGGKESRRESGHPGVSSKGARARSKSPSYQCEQEGYGSEVNDELVEDALGELRHWLQDNDVGGLSVAQMGAHLLLQIEKSKVNLAKYMERMLASPDEGQEGVRQRGILPLPCLDDSKEAVRQVLESGEYKRLAGSWSQKKNLGHGKVHREMRKQGLLIWHFLVVTALNFLWCGMKAGGRVCVRAATAAQKSAHDRIWQAVRIFVDDVSDQL